MSYNVNAAFQINMKDISADIEIKKKKDSNQPTQIFDPNNPEEKYSLDLT
jgi:hypothetical protein